MSSSSSPLGGCGKAVEGVVVASVECVIVAGGGAGEVARWR